MLDQDAAEYIGTLNVLVIEYVLTRLKYRHEQDSYDVSLE